MFKLFSLIINNYLSDRQIKFMDVVSNNSMELSNQKYLDYSNGNIRNNKHFILIFTY